MGSGSINFDRAVGFYDATRRENPATESAVTAVLAGELAGRGRALEIGVGTGRVALPLHRAGVPMAGVDLSAGMLGLLIDKAGGTVAFPLALADATALPFSTGGLGAALAAHVLHLIPPWQEAVGELVRVVQPGGVVLVCLTAGGPEPFRELRERFMEALGTGRHHVGVQGWEELDRAFREHGATPRLLAQLADPLMVAPEDAISRFERGEFSYTWPFDEAARRAAGAQVREWAVQEYGPLEQPRLIERQIVWRAYDLG